MYFAAFFLKAFWEYDILYRAKLDEARPCEAFDIRYARMGILYRANIRIYWRYQT